MPQYQTPGVYYERVDASAPAISAIRTDIAGFVGMARCGPLDTPVPVQSWRQFVAYFGEFVGAGYLAYAVRAFFENGGRRCWVVRVASAAAATAQLVLRGFATGDDIWCIQAFSPGVWGNNLDIRLVETHRAQTVTDPAQSVPDYATVASTSGFTRYTLVRLSQVGAAPQSKVICDVDGIAKRLIWQHEKPEARLPYDAPLTGLDISQPIQVESVEYSLLVYELGRLVRLYEGLSLIPDHPQYGPARLGPIRIPNETAVAKGIPSAPEPIVIRELRQPELPASFLEALDVAPETLIQLEGGADGLALLSVYDFIGEAVSPLDSDQVKAGKARGLRILEEISEVAILAVPDIHIQPIATPTTAPLPPCLPDPCLPPPPAAPAALRQPSVGDLSPRFSEADIYQVQAAMVQQCEERRDRMALLDPPYAAAQADEVGVSAAQAWRSRFDSKYAAFYYPWLRVVDPLRTPTALTRDIPPSGHVAGQYARTDLEIGVHKAPANAPLVWVQDITVAVDDAGHGLLNETGINVIRAWPGRGIRIFGARTVSSDPSWRYVNVRRLVMMIEKAIDLATQWAVFEPNDVFTRAKLRLSLTSFLIALWQRGALMGSAVQEAFFVKCDEDNNLPDERSRGCLLAEVGVAPAIPFEFIVLRVERTANELEIAEAFGRFGGG
jgi:uncharacterized protein